MLFLKDNNVQFLSSFCCCLFACCSKENIFQYEIWRWAILLSLKITMGTLTDHFFQLYLSPASHSRKRYFLSRTRIVHEVKLQVSMLWEHSPVCEGKLCMIVYHFYTRDSLNDQLSATQRKKNSYNLSALPWDAIFFSYFCAFKLITRSQCFSNVNK